jgi:serine/threonine protein kinase
MYLIAEHDDVRSSGFKIVVDCHNTLNMEESKLDWLENIQQDIVVVKIGNAQENIQHEFDIAQELYKHSIPGILQYFFYFTCKNDICNYPAKSPPHMCRAGRGENMKILVMEYISSSNFLQYDFKITDLALFHSCIHQILSILFEAYLSFEFVHGNTNLQNFLLKPSNKKTLNFPLLGVDVPINGYEICMMDFECSHYGDSHKFWNDILYIFAKINYTFRWDIDMTQINLYTCFVCDITPTYKHYEKIIEMVYKIQFNNPS